MHHLAGLTCGYGVNIKRVVKYGTDHGVTF